MLGLDAGGAWIRHSLFTYFILIFNVYIVIVLELISLVMLVLFISISNVSFIYNHDHCVFPLPNLA